MKLCINYLLISYLMVGLFLSPSSCIASKLKVVSTENKLLQYKEKNQLKGPSAEIFKLLMVDAKLSATVDFMPWSRAFKLASEQANTMIFTMVRTSERESKFHWLLAVSDVVRAFVSLKQRPELKLSTIAQAKNHSIAVVRGSYGLSSLLKLGFKEGENIYLVANNKIAINLLMSEKVDFIFVDPSILTPYFLAQGIVTEQVINKYIFPETRSQGYIALNKNSTPELVRVLQLSAKHVMQNSLYQYYYHLEP
ncbi:hypothetical protein tinsulaeT_18170 [Thalassotalea insulae]|uniref:Solute-binding protein family 3/N-terminal domain-containing protein n=1 Tax=Thalassotalea insulae TaxID=2056778 RepID=A0ABQ6GRC9_9GAMM|nr:transporter substrate-binding domain-containing protein [Thalassotalea insulae]GLX78477.1 hypothetical protein tinsulaeT_18170 [Thalassotalea insulae]